MSDTKPLSTEALEHLCAVAHCELNHAGRFSTCSEGCEEARAELTALRTGIAEAVKAAEEAQSERIIALLKRNGVVEGPRGFIAEIRRLDQPGALDRYVASKVREAKIAALDKCLGLIRDIKSGKGVRIPGVLQPAEDLTRLQVAIESLKIADS